MLFTAMVLDRRGDSDEHREGDEREHASGTATYYAYDVAGRLVGEYDPA